MLESMGLAGKWQKAGNTSPHPGLPPGGEGEREGGQILVCITNHGPEGADVSVSVRLDGGDLRGMTKALGALGIEVAA
jgi:hypothetical protein